MHGIPLDSGRLILQPYRLPEEENVEFDDTLSASMDDFAENTQDMEIPESLPMMAVRDVVVFNYMIIPLFVGRPGSIEAVNDAMNGDKLLMLVTQKDATKDDPDPEDMYQVGMVSMIMRTLKLPDGRLKVLVQALSKAKIRKYRTDRSPLPGGNRPGP